MSLPLLKQIEWRAKIAYIKKNYPNLHIFYSAEEGWCYISMGCYVGHYRIKIFHTESLEEINRIIQSNKYKL